MSGQSYLLAHGGPQVLLVVHGTMVARDRTGASVPVPRGGSLFIPPGAPGVTITGHGRVFRAGDGLVPGRSEPMPDQLDREFRAL